MSSSASKEHYTRTGKSTHNSDSSSLYTLGQTTPPWTLFTGLDPDLVDDEGRRYWKVHRLESENWKWCKLAEIEGNTTLFDAKTDEIYYFRNPVGKNMLEMSPPEISLDTPVFFSAGVGYRMKGFIKDNGNDEIQMAMVPKTGRRRGLDTRARRTSYVILTQLQRIHTTVLRGVAKQ